VDVVVSCDIAGEYLRFGQTASDRVGRILECRVGLRRAERTALQRPRPQAAVQSGDEPAILIGHEVDDESDVELLTGQPAEQDRCGRAPPSREKAAGRRSAEGETLTFERSRHQGLTEFGAAGDEEIVAGRQSRAFR
jgi:hypothetical protein